MRDPDVIAAMAETPNVMPQLHMPLQSGSDRILQAMRRSYRAERYLAIIERVREAMPDAAITTDIIVGFPGETEADFEETRELFEACNYDMAFIFKYSIRSGTVAAELADQVPDKEKERRNQILLDILRRNSERRNATLIDTIEEVLVEGPDKTGQRFTGRTRGNRVTIFDADPRLVGELVPLKVERASVSTLYGSLVLSGVPDSA